MIKKYANLHFHSTHSDGPYSPECLVEIAKQEGYRGLALTDHDTVTGVMPFIQACKKAGLEYLNGAEFYADGAACHYHIVGLDFDITHPRMAQHLEYTRNVCVYRTKGMFDAGVARGTIRGITWKEVEAANEGITWLCVDHVFEAMRKKGVITVDEYNSFHRQNFSYRIPFKNIYSHKNAEEVIAVIREAGGVAVLAHPGFAQIKYVPELVRMGLNGIETWNGDHSDEEIKACEELAHKYKLYESGGTDHNGPMGGCYLQHEDEEKNPYYLPSRKYGVSEENFRKIKERVLG